MQINDDKKKEAPFICKERKKKPESRSFMICKTLEKLSSTEFK